MNRVTTRSKFLRFSVFVMPLLIILFLLQCMGQSALMVKLTRNKPKVAVIYSNVRPEGERVQELVYGNPRKTGSPFPPQFSEVAEIVKEEMQKALPESEVFIPEHSSEFEAKVVAGIYLKGQYLKLFSEKYQLVIRAYLVFKDKKMREYYGKDDGYEVARVESDELHIDEADEKFENKMMHQGLEAIMEEHPPINMLPKLKEELRKGVAKVMKKI